MKGYSSEIPENCARARIEGVNASYKDLSQVCGRIRNKKSSWALDFLNKASEGEIPVFYSKHNKNLGHRRELGGRKGRYPEKAAKIVLKALQSAIANGRVIGLGGDYMIVAASANKKNIYPRMAPKGRSARSFLETSRVELILKGEVVPKGVKVTPPSDAPKKSSTPTESKPKTETPQKTEIPQKAETSKVQVSEKTHSKEAHEHKHGTEKPHDDEKQHEKIPHQHDKR